MESPTRKKVVIAKPTPRAEQKQHNMAPVAAQPSRDRNLAAVQANGYLEISEGTSAIHPNTGIRKANSVGCTQSMEHSSGMWYDGREFNSGTLEDLDFEPVESPCGNSNNLFMCYYAGEPYADSEAVYSDEDEEDDALYDEGDDEEGELEDDDDEEEDDNSIDEPLYMQYKGRHAIDHSLVSGHRLGADKADYEQDSKMSSPVDARDLHGRLMVIQGQDCSS